MNKTMFVWIIAMVLLVASVSGLQPLNKVNASLTVQPTYYWDFDGEVNGTNIEGDIGEVTLTLQRGGDEIVSSGLTGFNQSFYSNNNGGNSQSLAGTIVAPRTNNYSISFLYRSSDDTQIPYYIFSYGSGSGFLWGRPEGNEGLNVYVGAAEALINFPADMSSTGVWNRYTYVRDVTNGVWLFYLNGTNTLNDSTIVVKDITYTNFEFNDYWDDRGLKGTFDDLAIWNGHALTPAEVTLLSSTTIIEQPFINISNGNPANNTQFNSGDISFNAVYNSSMITNCSLYISEVFNQTIGNLPVGKNIQVNFTETLSPGTWNWSMSCFNSSSLSQNANTTTNIFYVDSVIPSVITNFVNKSSYFLENITAQFNITDNIILSSYNISIDGTQVSGITQLNSSWYNVNFSYNPKLLSPGKHELVFRAADGHTKEELAERKDWDWNNGLFNNRLKFEWDRGVYKEGEVTIKSKDGSIFDSWKAIEDFDRFRFTFEPNTLSDTYTFEVESDMDIEVIDAPNTKWKKWIIINQEHWLDFYIDGTEEVEIVQNPKNPKEIEVTISNINPANTKLEFQSIGDLNIAYEYYTFSTINTSEVYTQIITSGTATDLTLNINDTGLGNIYSTKLEWNNTNYTASYSGVSNNITIYTQTITPPIVSALVNISHRWWINTSIYEPTALQNQSVYKANISICDATNTNRVLNITYLDEVDDTILSLNNSYGLKFYDGIYYYNFSGTESANNLGFCTNIPDTLSYNWNVFGTMTMAKGGYVTRLYSIDEGFPLGVSNNPEINLTLFMVKINESSTITYNWITSDLTPVNGILRIYHCNLDGSKSLVESIQIINGVAVGNIVLLTEQYSYEVIIDDILYTESPGWGVCHVESSTSASYVVDVSSTNILPQMGMGSIVCSMTKTSNVTVMMNWTANDQDPSYVSGCILVYRQDISGSVLVYENCTTEGYSHEVQVPALGWDYIIQGQLKQGGNTYLCSESVSFNFKEFGGEILGTGTTLFAIFLLVASLILFYSGEGEFMMAAAAVGILLSWILGILFLPWLEVSAIIVFLTIIAFVGRTTKK